MRSQRFWPSGLAGPVPDGCSPALSDASVPHFSLAVDSSESLASRLSMLSWNEIRHRAIKISREWKGTTSEKSERQTFWNEFFDIFVFRRRTVAAFEEPVRESILEVQFPAF